MKKHHICEKDYIWNPATCSFKNRKYLASVIDDSMITCNEMIRETKTLPTNFDEKKVTYKTRKIYIVLGFLLITIVLFTAVTIYC